MTESRSGQGGLDKAKSDVQPVTTKPVPLSRRLVLQGYVYPKQVVSQRWRRLREKVQRESEL